jgi:Flp pilus assembly protein TadB
MFPMRTQKEYEEGIETQRKLWKENFERRWAQVERTTASAKRDFQKWLDGFRPEPFAAPEDMKSTLHDRVDTTSMVWALAAILLCVWTLGMVTSVTLGGGIHLAFACAMVLILAAWLRRRQSQEPMTLKSRSGRGHHWRMK